jgi:hypothetical protein
MGDKPLKFHEVLLRRAIQASTGTKIATVYAGELKGLLMAGELA